MSGFRLATTTSRRPMDNGHNGDDQTPRSDPYYTAAFETRAIHVGQEPDPTTGAVITPIYQTSTFAQEQVGVHKGYEYARTDNPTRTALQAVMASLEGGRWALAYSSGLAATQNLMQ